MSTILCTSWLFSITSSSRAHSITTWWWESAGCVTIMLSYICTYIINHSQIACETCMGMTARLACDCGDKNETGWAFRCCTAWSIESYIAVSLHPIDRKQTIKTKTEPQHKLYQITCIQHLKTFTAQSHVLQAAVHTADATSLSMTPTLLQAHRKSALDSAKAVMSKKNRYVHAHTSYANNTHRVHHKFLRTQVHRHWQKQGVVVKPSVFNNPRITILTEHGVVRTRMYVCTYLNVHPSDECWIGLILRPCVKYRNKLPTCQHVSHSRFLWCLGRCVEELKRRSHVSDSAKCYKMNLGRNCW